jgi:hypothetical protein
MRCSSKGLFIAFSVLLIVVCIKRKCGRSSNAPSRRDFTLPTLQRDPQSTARTGWTIFLSGPSHDVRASSAHVTGGLARPENAYHEGANRTLDYTAPVGTKFPNRFGLPDLKLQPPGPPPLPIDTQYPPPLYELRPQPPGYQERRI